MLALLQAESLVWVHVSSSDVNYLLMWLMDKNGSSSYVVTSHINLKIIAFGLKNYYQWQSSSQFELQTQLLKLSSLNHRQFDGLAVLTTKPAVKASDQLLRP